MVFDAAGNLLQADDGGVFRRTSPQDNNGDWFSMNGNLNNFEYHSIAYDTNSDWVIAGSVDNGTQQAALPSAGTSTAFDVLLGSTLFPADVQNGVREEAILRGGSGGDVAVGYRTDPNDSSRTQSIRYFTEPFLSQTDEFGVRNAQETSFRIRFQVYNDDGSNSGGIQSNSLSRTDGTAFSPRFTTPIAVNALDGNRILLGAASGGAGQPAFGIFESVNRGRDD